ncbi:MAG TPA: hypothetical protein VE969_03000 [Pyrinomonadaceae bacterium]|nr:hypothetical protein [Pyrinomonadaceae bacterium]
MPLPNPSQFKPVSDVSRDADALRQLTDAHADWFISIDGRAPLNVNKNEFDFSAAHARLIFSCWTETGSTTWHVKGWTWTGEKLVLQASRRMGAEVATVELIPRASAKAIAAGIAAARQERSNHLANLVSEYLSAKVEKSALSPGMRRDQPGRYARIILRLPHERIAVTGIVAESDVRNVDSLFSSTLLWFQRMLQSPKRPHVQRLLLVVERQILDPVRQRHVLLRDSLRERIDLLLIDEHWTAVTPVARFERKQLWRKRLTRFPPVNEAEASDRTEEIVTQAPDAIDAVASRHGQTLRYHGLPFARVRHVMNQDRIWFGIEGSRRRSLDEYHTRDWLKLLRDLGEYRNADCRDRRHWLYRASGEAWLESILRRDITKLDPGLIIAPLHAQFRTSHGGPTGARPIDLLALRHDGRLVVIELKVNEDREHVFQGVDYWRRVEAHRRRGHISSAQLFGEREISDESPLVYLVAPALHFHPSFRTLAQTIAPDIEVYRFDINEDWRDGVRVVRRERVNA